MFRTRYTSRILSNDLKLISTREYVAQTDSKRSLLGHKVTTLFGIHKWEINCKYLLTFNVKYFLIFVFLTRAFYAFLYARIFQKRFLPRVRLRNKYYGNSSFAMVSHLKREKTNSMHSIEVHHCVYREWIPV